MKNPRQSDLNRRKLRAAIRAGRTLAVDAATCCSYHVVACDAAAYADHVDACVASVDHVDAGVGANDGDGARAVVGAAAAGAQWAWRHN